MYIKLIYRQTCRIRTLTRGIINVVKHGDYKFRHWIMLTLRKTFADVMQICSRNGKSFINGQ